MNESEMIYFILSLLRVTTILSMVVSKCIYILDDIIYGTYPKTILKYHLVM